jgi:hypothetical protein
LTEAVRLLLLDVKLLFSVATRRGLNKKTKTPFYLKRKRLSLLTIREGLLMRQLLPVRRLAAAVVPLLRLLPVRRLAAAMVPLLRLLAAMVLLLRRLAAVARLPRLNASRLLM